MATKEEKKSLSMVIYQHPFRRSFNSLLFPMKEYSSWLVARIIMLFPTPLSSCYDEGKLSSAKEKNIRGSLFGEMHLSFCMGSVDVREPSRKQNLSLLLSQHIPL